LLAHGLFWSGTYKILLALRQRNVLLVLNYHRIGNPADDLFDPGVFSATVDQLEAQISFVKRHFCPVTLEEAVAFVNGSDHAQTRRCRVLITFDDGYLDNYELAFPILRSHQVQGVFFLATSLVGSCTVPWWDSIAYLLRTASQRRFVLSYPDFLEVDLAANGLTRSLNDVLALFKRAENTDTERFFNQLRDAAGAKEPLPVQRRFLNWDEARTMLAGGMVIGSHTHSHTVLSQLDHEAQRHELSHSRSQLKDCLGVDIDTLAYPVGLQSSFSDTTQHIARECGYRAAFSFYGGINARERANPYNIMRIGIGEQSWVRFRVQTSFCASLGTFWP
jgi:peptidoglycan/xylan/chitin deacetylase (PgdA/CDA1 family)